MASIAIGGGTLQVRLSALERMGAFHSSISVPLAAVRNVQTVDEPFRSLRGMRAPGTGFPGVIGLGTWRYRGGKDFVAIYGGRRAVSIELEGAEFNRLLIGMADPERVLTELQRARR